MTIYTDYKNLITFITTKVLSRRQIRQSELLGQYKFKIVYTLRKDNGRTDVLLRRSDYMKDKDLISYSILKQNQDGSLSANVLEFNRIIRIYRDDKEQFLIVEGKHQVLNDKIQDYISTYYDNLIVGYPGVARTIELIRRAFIFPRIKERVKTYINRCIRY